MNRRDAFKASCAAVIAWMTLLTHQEQFKFRAIHIGNACRRHQWQRAEFEQIQQWNYFFFDDDYTREYLALSDAVQCQPESNYRVEAQSIERPFFSRMKRCQSTAS